MNMHTTPPFGRRVLGTAESVNFRQISAESADKSVKSAEPIDVATGARVRLERRKRGISQEELAGKIGVSFQQVQKYENGTNRLSISRLFMIAAALNVSPAGLLPLEAGDAEHVGAALDVAGLTKCHDGTLILEALLRLSPERLGAVRRILEAFDVLSGDA